MGISLLERISENSLRELGGDGGESGFGMQPSSYGDERLESAGVVELGHEHTTPGCSSHTAYGPNAGS